MKLECQYKKGFKVVKWTGWHKNEKKTSILEKNDVRNLQIKKGTLFLCKGHSTVDSRDLLKPNKTSIFVETRDDKLSKTSIRSKKY